VQASSLETVRQTVRDLLGNPERVDALRRRSAELARPTAALESVKLLFELANGVAPHAAKLPTVLDRSTVEL
jgi:hypothetical protein